jgi:hypothetical protein
MRGLNYFWSVNRILFCLFLLFANAAFSRQPLPPIGNWREHLPYQSALDVTAAGNKIYTATPYSLFSVDVTENSVERLSKITGLSETGISAIGYDAVNEKLIIAYSNSNIDIIYRNDIYNIPDIKNDNIAGDKSIYNIYPRGDLFYLCTGLGVVVVDGNRYEVKDSWFIGNGGNKTKVNGFTSNNSFFYAAMMGGLKRIAVNNPNPADYNNWQLLSGTNGLSSGEVTNVISLQSKIIALKNDSLFVLNGMNWTLFYQDGLQVSNMSVSGNKIFLCQRLLNGQGKLTVLNADGSVANSIPQQTGIAVPKKAIAVNNDYWIADSSECLSRFNPSFAGLYKLNSPVSISLGDIKHAEGGLYAASGTVTNGWIGQNNKNGIYQFTDGDWKNINVQNSPPLDSLPDLISLAIDRRDKTIWAGSFGGGLLHVKGPGSFEVFKQNSPLANSGSYRVSGLAFDREDNLWVAAYGANELLHVKKNDGSWKSFTAPLSIGGNRVGQVLIDDNNFKWIVSPSGNGLICFDDNGTIDNTADDKWRLLTAGGGNGNLPSPDVFCVEKDKEGFIWAGTANGIGVIPCVSAIFSSNGCDAFWPVVQQGNFADYLFKGEEVRSIATDGANRKWVATKNGVWLMSADGEKVIYNFNESNSPLLSNDVKRITIAGETGEVFFASAKGICSFRSTATEGKEKNENLLVFPNPVPPGYSGTIAIRGVVNNAIVKITELNGRLVYQTRAWGGQAVWDGRDYRGKKIETGIYLVLISDESRKENASTKIVFISK